MVLPLQPDSPAASTALRSTLALFVLAAPTAALPQMQGCPVPLPSNSDPRSFEHRWAGLVHDSFTLDGQEVWTGEDGGRIRHRDPQTGLWSFQDVPLEVQGMIRRIHFLSNGLDGWAVSADGWVLYTDNGGASWDTQARIPRLLSSSTEPWEELQDVWFAENGLDGWIVGLHGILYTDDGGVCWDPADLIHPNFVIDDDKMVGWHVELYALDVQIGGEYFDCPGGGAPSDYLGLVSAQPGWILRSLDYGRTWYVTKDLLEDPCPNIGSDCLYQGCLYQEAPWFELWDVEISDHLTDPLALVVGGVGTGCGLVLSSTDDGCTWSLEPHECEGDPGLDCSTNPDYDQTTTTFRHDSYRTLYGVGIFDVDNTAVAAGYNGQHVFRDFLTGGAPVWRDRSEFGAFTDAPHLTTVYPMYGVSTEDGQTATGRAWVTGAGGHIRRSTDAGDTWQQQTVGEPFRVYDVWFKEQPQGPDVGWQVGQFFRLAFSNDGGATWAPGDPPPDFPQACTLESLTFAGNGLTGVAVGTPIPDQDQDGDKEGPRILQTSDFGQLNGWAEPTSVTYASQSEEDEHRNTTLREVCWAGDAQHLQFWAVGTQGLILRTTDGGDTWTQVPLAPSLVPDPHVMDLYGVSAASPSAIVVVGSEGHGNNPLAAKAWSYVASSWSEIPIDSPGTGPVERLTDVASLGSATYAVGQRQVAGGADPRTGVVLRYDPGDDEFETFDGPMYPLEIEPCAYAGAGLTNQVLTEVEITGAGDVWIAGLCGQVWQWVDATSTWQEHKSQTDADVRGMMFLSPERGYVAANGGKITNQVVVRHQDPE